MGVERHAGGTRRRHVLDWRFTASGSAVSRESAAIPRYGLLAADAQFTARSSRHRGRNRTTRDGGTPARGGGGPLCLPRRAHFHPRSPLTRPCHLDAALSTGRGPTCFHAG